MSQPRPARPATEVTEHLLAAGLGDDAAQERLLGVVYQQLKALARSRLSRRPPGETLQATALVHEAWIRLGGGDARHYCNRAHFFGAASLAMRNILVERARRRARLKRGGGQARRDLTPEVQIAADAPTLDLLELDAALTRLATVHARPARIVTMRYFAGMTVGEVAQLLEISPRTVDRDWIFARAWLKRALHPGPDPD